MQAIAEVISSSITSIVAQCSSDPSVANKRPVFGGFICIDSQQTDLKYLAVVYNITTGPLDSVHRPVAFGMTREQLKQEQPQIFSLLQTDIHAALIGFIKGKKAYSYLPSQPPDVHDFVYAASKDDVEKIVDNFDFLRLLCTVNIEPVDELLAAAIREAYLIHNKNHQLLLAAGLALAQLFRADYERLLSILRRIRPQEDQ